MSGRLCLSFVLAFLLLPRASVLAGVFNGAEMSNRPNFIITHPPGFMGDGGELVVRVCVREDSLSLVGPLQRVLATWNALEPMAGNCPACSVVNDPPPPPEATADAFSTLLHEVGHCAMGLGEINWTEPSTGAVTNYTNSRDTIAIALGDDRIEGSNDDVVFPLPGSRIIHWYRRSDNDPVVIDDGTVIDEATFTRALSALPVGHRWPASANRVVAESLGSPNTHAVMFSVADRDDTYLGLTADEVNMIRFARTGLDKIAGTPDDYVARLVYVADCATADFDVFFGVSTVGFGRCTSATASIPNPPLQTQHFRVVPLTLIMGETEDWDFGSLIFEDGFEEGDLSAWNDTVP